MSPTGPRLDADVAVVGVGSVGSLALWHLARRGLRVVGFEQFAPGHDRGAAGGESRVFRVAYHEGAAYVPLLLDARSQWERLGRETGASVFEPCGYLEAAPAGDPGLAATLAAATSHGLDHLSLDADALADRYPQHRFGPEDEGVLDQAGGALRPELAVAGAARYAEVHGVEVVRHVRIDRLDADDDAVLLQAGGQRWRARSVVVTTGAWADRLVPELRGVVTPTRLALTWFPALHPEQFAADVFPAFGRTVEGTFIYGVPSLDGRTVKVATTRIDDPAPVDPDHLDRNVPVEVTARISDLVARYVPGLVPDPVRAAAYVDGYTLEGHGLVGVHPRHRNVVVVAGLSGHGFKLAPSLAQAAVELATVGRTDLPVGFLDPGRLLGGVAA